MKSDGQVLSELARAAEGLWYMSESDYPLEVFAWDASAEVTPEYLRRAAGADADAGVEAREAPDFFDPARFVQQGPGGAALAGAAKAETLRRLLIEHLEGLRVYRVGRVNIPVFIVGRSRRTGSWVGLSTRVVET